MHYCPKVVTICHIIYNHLNVKLSLYLVTNVPLKIVFHPFFNFLADLRCLPPFRAYA